MSTNVRLRSVCLSVLALFLGAATHAVDFGAKVPFKKDTAVSFPEFTVTYVGERRVVTPKYSRGMVFYDFRVTAAEGGTQTISWSSGTGDIGPTLFHVGAGQFALELKRSDKLGPLKENEMVVSRVP